MKEAGKEFEVANQGEAEGDRSADSDRSVGSYQNMRLLFLIVSVLLTGIATWGVAHGIKQDFLIPASAIVSGRGVSYSTVLPARLYWLFEVTSDGSDNPTRSKTELFENDRPLGPAHSDQETLRSRGSGQFSNWGSALYFSTSDSLMVVQLPRSSGSSGSALYFSTSDNSDPRTNGRRYKAVITAASPMWVLVVLVLCLLISLYLNRWILSLPLMRPAVELIRKNIHFLFLIGSLFLAGVALLGAYGIKQDIPLPASAIASGTGFGYITVLPERRYWVFESPGDSPYSPTLSKAELFENDTPLGPAHSAQDAIRGVGSGQFSHWGSALYFSTSNNSDPRTNGRRYKVVITAASPMWVSVVLVLCLLISLYLNRWLVGLPLMRQAVELTQKNIHLLFPIGSLFLAGVALLGAYGIKQDIPIPASAIARGREFNYRTILPAPRYWLFENLTDSPDSPTRSKTELFENDTPLGPAHSAHDAIRSIGSGQFSHWGSALYFSTSDNSDPCTNGRRYKAIITAGSPRWVLALLVLCFLISLYSNRWILRLPLLRPAVEWTQKNINLLFLIGSLFLAGVALLGANGSKQDIPLPASAIARGTGFSYTTVLPAPRYWLFENLTDDLASPTRSRTELFENDTPLGPAHSAQDAIRSAGKGQFSHWGSTLYFSTTDNSDPHTNGRRYRVVITATSPMWLLAILLLCLPISLYFNRWLLSVPLLRPAVEWTQKNIQLLFLIGSILLTGMAIWGVAHGIKQEFLIPASAMASESGASYTTALPTSPYWLFENLTDSPDSPARSRTELFENDTPLGPAHASHDVIRSAGSGQFSHWGSALYFSTADNSDPHTNGRRYKVVVTATLSLWVLAVSVLCLLISLYLNRWILSLPIMLRQTDESSARRKIRWRWGVLAALALALLSLYPQIDLWLTRGAEWQGSYASLNYDEETYAAYINGLVLGRPLRTAPLEMPDPGKPPHESLFSIQFVPAYFVASFARVLGFTVAKAFILLTPLVAFLTTLVLFYLLASVTRDEAFAAVSALAVLVFGTLAARHSVAFGWMGWNWYGSFLFLRRYQPAAAFPIFLGFIPLIWQALTKQGRQGWRAAVAAGVVFSVLVFSYFFLWTAAVAWLVCFVLIWVAAYRAEWRMVAKRLAPTALCGAATLAVYGVMLAHRDPVIDKVQFLTFTHAPDFYRAPLWIGAVVILLLLWGVRQGRVQWREPAVVIAGSFALMPFAVFNQQLITGRLLQPVHYEMFSANYVSLLALILALVILWHGRRVDFERRVPGWLIALLLCVVIGWGVVEMNGITSQFKERNVARDRFVPVAKRLAQLAAARGKGANDREMVFSPDILVVSDNLPVFAPQVPLWGSGISTASGLSIQEQHERCFQYLYYSGVGSSSLQSALVNNAFVVVSAVFGYERYNPSLTSDFRPITSNEIQDKVREYDEYVASFDRERALHPQLSYVVVYTKSRFDFSNIERWYDRDAGEQIGPFTLYQLKPLKSSNFEQMSNQTPKVVN